LTVLKFGRLLFERDHEAVGDFYANNFFFTAIHEAIFHVNGCSGIRSERAAGGKLNVAGAVKHVDALPK
jgi:hypothetical protein